MASSYQIVVAYFVFPTIYTLKMKVRFDMRGYTNLFTNTVAIPDHNRLVVKKVFPISNGVEIGQCWICAVLWQPFWKWRTVEIVQCRESIRDIIIYPHIKFWWYRTMLNFCDIVAAILKMATGRNFSMSGIISGHHYLPTYQIWKTSDNVEFLPPIFYAMFW